MTARAPVAGPGHHRRHGRASSDEARYALSIVLGRTGRTKEARALRPRGGWPHERRPRPSSGSDGAGVSSIYDVAAAYSSPSSSADDGGSYSAPDSGLATETGSANTWE